jgi:hypothetical protein
MFVHTYEQFRFGKFDSSSVIVWTTMQQNHPLQPL